MRLRKPLVALSAALLACGASPRMLQRSATYYEQCQSAELNPRRTIDERRECWEAWLKYYTQGQPLERIGYAQDRRIGLAHGEEVAPLPDREDRGLELRSSQAANASPPDAPSVAPNAPASMPEAQVNEALENTHAIVDPSEFRQDEGAPPGRHFSVRTVTPPDEAPVPQPPGGADGACGAACNPAWYRCAEGCHGHSGGCMNACAARQRQCRGACNGGGH